MRTALLLVVALLLAPLTAAVAQLPGFVLPLRCTPGTDCWIANHVDLDPGPGVRDYTCGKMTYEGHNGIDFAIRDLKAMTDGVAVLAAAAGRVLRTRDDEPDESVRERAREAVAGRECGNAVVIAHADGYQTQYCHMRRGSVSVRVGDEVAAGQPIGFVGLSGLTEYPHLHWTVRRGARVLDAFRGEARVPVCGAGEAPLWSAQTLAALPYAPRAVYNFGVSPAPVAPDAVRRGEHRARSLSIEAPLYAVWMEAFAVRAGDAVEITVTAPDGTSFLQYQRAIERDQARIFRFTARKRGAMPWAAGVYVNRIRVGAGEGASSIEFTVDVR